MIKKLDLIFNNISFKRKIWFIQLFSLTISLFLICLFIISYQLYSNKSDLLKQAQVIANILGENSKAALVFEDQKDAEGLLQSLRFNPIINSAIIRLSDGKILASYHKEKDSDSKAANYFEPLLNDHLESLPSLSFDTSNFDYKFSFQELIIHSYITLPNQKKATIELYISLNDFYRNLISFILAIIIIMLIILILFLSFSNRLQQITIQPLIHLTNLMSVISEHHDYTKRLLINNRQDEIGSLARGFNSMLTVIEHHQNGLRNELKERKKTELELSVANHEIQRRHKEIQAAYHELSTTHKQLVHSEKMASLGILVAGVAHELNNPISYIYSNLEFIEEYTDKLLKITLVEQKNENTIINECEIIVKTLRDLIASCRDGSERVKKIVLELRTFSRTDDQGRMPTDLHQGIESTLTLLGYQYQDRITIHRDYGPIPLIYCYPSQINQVFMNLLQNAIQAIPSQGEVWIQTLPVDKGIHIIIRDNGAGISDEHLDHIFDPFFTTKPTGIGTGLGLSISYGIIKNHGGKIKAESQLNVGTKFTVELPIRAENKNLEHANGSDDRRSVSQWG